MDVYSRALAAEASSQANDILTNQLPLKANQSDLTTTNQNVSTNASLLADIAINVRNNGTIDPTGVVDSTTAIQTALNKSGRVIIPSGTYLVGALTMPSYTQLIGIGKVTFKHNMSTGFVTSGWNRAMITNANQPTYADPSATTRPNVQGVVTNISIENIIFDGNGQAVQGIQLTAVDYFTAKNVTIKNLTQATTYFVGLRYSKLTDCLADTCAGDAFAITDKHFGGKRGFSFDVTFENCTVQNCGSTPSVSDPIPSMYEISDGPTHINFINCKAINNNGCGFDFHIHTTDWDLQNISLVNCKSINNTMTTNAIGVTGFVLGQCPLGSTFKNITYENCISIGSQTAFASLPGSELGYKENVSILGGYWENSFANGISTNNSVIYLGKQFRSFKISNANLVGVTDSYGFYSYSVGDGVKIDNVTIKGCYIPLGLTHSGGKAEINNTSMTVTSPSSTLSTVCVALEADDVVVNGMILNLDASKYSSSIIRIISDKKVSASNILLENTGTLGGNAIQFDTVGMGTLTGCIIKNFTNGVFFSNTSTQIVSVGNNFKGCTSKYNSTPAYLIDVGNAI